MCYLKKGLKNVQHRYSLGLKGELRYLGSVSLWPLISLPINLFLVIRVLNLIMTTLFHNLNVLYRLVKAVNSQLQN